MRRIHLTSHLTTDELAQRYRRAHDPVERSRWQMLWLLSSGHTATAIAPMLGYRAYWIGQVARRYNQGGPASVADKRHQWPGGPPMLSAEGQAERREALRGPAPEGDTWTGRTVAEWLSRKLSRPVPSATGWAYLRRLGLRPLVPRPRQVKADPAAQEAFTGGSVTPSAR